MTDVFLTHDWGTDENGQSNHARVSVVNAALKQRGYVTWFDEERMEGNIVSKMCEGIENTRVVVVFITQRYMDKLASGDESDNCKKEFGHAERTHSGACMLPVVMERRMRKVASWKGLLGFTLGGTLAVMMDFDFSDETKFFEGIEDMARQINIKLAKTRGSIPYTPKDVAGPQPPAPPKNVVRQTAPLSYSAGKSTINKMTKFKIVSPTTATGWAWDVQLITLTNSHGNDLPVTNPFDSGSVYYDDPKRYGGYHCSKAFEKSGSWWGGRKNTADVFEIGGEANITKQGGLTVEVYQKGGHVVTDEVENELKKQGKGVKFMVEQDGLWVEPARVTLTLRRKD